MYTSDQSLKDLFDVLSRDKFKKQITRPVDYYVDLQRNLTTPAKTEKIFANSPDSNDNFLFDLALQTNSEILVTGDKKLLRYKLENLEIISLSAFKERIALT